MSQETRRRIFLGPRQLEDIQVLDEVFNAPILINKYNLPKMDFRGIFFSTMIQCGVEEFAMISTDMMRDTPGFNSDFLSSRINFDSKLIKQYFNIYGKIYPLFEQYRENKNLERKDILEIHTTQMFLTDLLFGMKTNLGSVSIPPKPDPDLERLKIFLEPELFYPIRNLMLLIENDNLKLPIPTQSILHQDVQKYEEIINSGFFSKYVRSHQNLENNAISKPRALTQIRKDAKILRNQFSKYIDLKGMVINSLNMVPPTAEFFGGKICGNVAEKLLKIIEPICKNNISNNRRLVTYQFTPITEDVLKDRFFPHRKL